MVSRDAMATAFQWIRLHRLGSSVLGSTDIGSGRSG